MRLGIWYLGISVGRRGSGPLDRGSLMDNLKQETPGLEKADFWETLTPKMESRNIFSIVNQNMTKARLTSGTLILVNNQ